MNINHPTIATNFGVRSTFVEVNLSQLSRNLQAIRETNINTRVPRVYITD